MRTYEDNVEVINQLWQSFSPTQELRQLFRERLHKLDQGVLYEAIKQAKVDNEGPWPAIKWFTTAYAECNRKRRWTLEEKRASQTGVRNVIPQPDTDAEKKLVRDFYAAIEGCDDQGFRDLDALILKKYDEHLLSSVSAFRLCRQLRLHVLGDSAGLSKVTSSGDIVPLEPGLSF